MESYDFNRMMFKIIMGLVAAGALVMIGVVVITFVSAILRPAKANLQWMALVFGKKHKEVAALAGVKTTSTRRKVRKLLVRKIALAHWLKATWRTRLQRDVENVF